jgi:hypothetical protein
MGQATGKVGAVMKRHPRPPDDIEWLPGTGGYEPDVTPFPGSKLTCCLDGIDGLVVAPKSFPLVLQIDIGGVSKVIRIEETSK